jgi:hypothetical protein
MGRTGNSMPDMKFRCPGHRKTSAPRVNALIEIDIRAPWFVSCVAPWHRPHSLSTTDWLWVH